MRCVERTRTRTHAHAHTCTASYSPCTCDTCYYSVSLTPGSDVHDCARHSRVHPGHLPPVRDTCQRVHTLHVRGVCQERVYMCARECTRRTSSTKYRVSGEGCMCASECTRRTSSTKYRVSGEGCMCASEACLISSWARRCVFHCVPFGTDAQPAPAPAPARAGVTLAKGHAHVTASARASQYHADTAHVLWQLVRRF